MSFGVKFIVWEFHDLVANDGVQQPITSENGDLICARNSAQVDVSEHLRLARHVSQVDICQNERDFALFARIFQFA